MAPPLPVAIGSLDFRNTSTVSAPVSPCGTISVPGTPSSLFDENTISISPSRNIDSKATSGSAITSHRRGLSTCSAPFDTLDLRSSSGSSPIQGVLNNGARSLQFPAESPNGQNHSQASNAECQIPSLSLKSSSSRDVLQEVQRQNRKSPIQTTQDEPSPTKGRKVARSDDGNEQNSMFITASEAEDSGEEGLRNCESGGEFLDVKTPKRTKRVFQEPKIKKAGQARKVSTISKSSVDKTKILLDFGAWVHDERTRKGSIGSLNPKEIFSHVRELIIVEDEESDFIAAQVTLMILSLGSTESIVNLKYVIDDMRNISQTRLVRPPVNIGNDEEKLLELVRWVFNSIDFGTRLDIFQSRYYISSFCNYMISEQDVLIRRNDNKEVEAAEAVEGAEAAERQIYASLIERAYPKITRYHENRKVTKRDETKAFMEAVEHLENKLERGYRWLALKKMFGIGIMALYYHSELFSETARISLDDDDVSEEEFNLLMSYLSTKGNAHRAWLQLLCKKVEAHLSQGVEEILVLEELFVEKWAIEQIESCREQSDWLLMMCETRESMSIQPGNKVTLTAWSAINNRTRMAAWQEGVEQGVYEEV